MVEHLSYKQRVIGSSPFVLKNSFKNRLSISGWASTLALFKPPKGSRDF